MSSQLQSTGSTFTSIVHDPSDPSDVTWVNPGNAVASDNIYAVATLAANLNSKWLAATGFGFTIPTGSTINGVQVEAEGKRTVVLADGFANIVVGGLIDETANISNGGWTASDAYSSAGGSTQLWGQTLTPAIVNASNFGAAVYAMADVTATVVSIDHIRITVFYTEGGVPKMQIISI